MSGRGHFTTSFVLQVFLDCHQRSCQITQYIQVRHFKTISKSLHNSRRHFIPFYCIIIILNRTNINFIRKLLPLKIVPGTPERVQSCTSCSASPQSFSESSASPPLSHQLQGPNPVALTQYQMAPNFLVSQVELYLCENIEGHIINNICKIESNKSFLRQAYSKILKQ